VPITTSFPTIDNQGISSDLLHLFPNYAEPIYNHNIPDFDAVDINNRAVTILTAVPSSDAIQAGLLQ